MSHSQAPAPATLSDLPADVRHIIFAYLRPCDVSPLAIVSHRWRAAIATAVEHRCATALKAAEEEYDAMHELCLRCQKLGSVLSVAQCPASPLWPNGMNQSHVFKFGKSWEAQPPAEGRRFYTELKAAVASGSWRHFNRAWVFFASSDRNTTAACAFTFAALHGWPALMKHMVALTHEYVNSAAAAAAYAGDVECLNLAVKLAGEASGQSVDIVRVLMSLAAGGHKELFRERVKSRELRADIGTYAAAAASRGQAEMLKFLIKLVRDESGNRVYIPWNQIMRAAAIARNGEDILVLCAANGAREFAECESVARMAGRVRNAELLVTLRK